MDSFSGKETGLGDSCRLSRQFRTSIFPEFGSIRRDRTLLF
jgi:hypothetical protein